MVATNRSGGDRKSAGGEDNFPKGIPSKPGDLASDESIVWDVLIEQVPNAIFRANDWIQFKILCVLVCREKKLAQACRSDPLDFKANRAHLATVQHIGRLSSIYGLSPYDRQRIKAPPEKQRTSIEEWMES